MSKSRVDEPEIVIDSSVFSDDSIQSTLHAFAEVMTVKELQRTSDAVRVVYQSELRPSLVEGEFRNYLIHAAVRSFSIAD